MRPTRGQILIRSGRPAVPNIRFFTLWLIAGALAGQRGGQAASSLPDAPDVEWKSYSGDLAGAKYAPLDQITAENVHQLRIAWTWRSVDGEVDLSQADQGVEGIRISNLKATPLMVDGLLYLATPLYQAAAIDAATGRTIWVYDPGAWRGGPPAMSMGYNQRGVAYWSDGTKARIFWGTNDGYLIAVDAKTGRPCPDFGQAGCVDLTEGIPRATRAKKDHRGRFDFSVASPPAICRDTIVVPCSISDDPMYKEMPPGHIQGYDPHTGKRKWIFRVVPEEGELGVETWENQSWTYTGGTNCWTQISADEEFGYFYIPTGSPTNDWYGGHRLGDNLFAECLLCLDAETGRRIWHYQIVRHGLWDYDPPCAPNLMDIEVGGRLIKAVAQVTKHGFVFVFDRLTGESVWPIQDRPVPEALIPGERTSPTQPFPTKPPPFESQGVAIDDLIDFTPALRVQAEQIVSKYVIGPLFTPPSLVEPNGKQGTIINPGWGGGANWTGAAYDPETGYLYVPSSTHPVVPVLRAPSPEEGNMDWVRQSVAGVRGPEDLPLLKPPYSTVTAFNMNTGEIAWREPHGEAPAKIRNHPALAGIDLPKLGSGGKGGPLLTKTLLFVPKSGIRGSDDPSDQPSLIAYDKATGRVVHEIPLPDSARGAPMSYRLNGKQYIAVTINGSPPELIALALP